MVAALVALDSAVRPRSCAAEPLSSFERDFSVAFVTIASAAYPGAPHTEARADCTAVARVDPATTVDVRRSL